MPWHPSLNQLRDALADLYPDVADARVVAATALLSLSGILSQGRPRTVWQSILEEALKQDCVEAIIAAAVAEYGKNPALLAAVQAYHRSTTRDPVSARAATAPAAADPSMLDLGGGLTLPLVRVPAGDLLMGSADTDTQAYDDEKPQHKLWLPDYLIGKYPVTVAQYRVFVQATHYQITYPDAIRQPDDHPVANVTWHEAMAFCDWAGHVSGRSVRLPSEAEWEKAARGTDGRIYPWGNRWDPARCNSKEKGPGATTPVGHYSPLGDSPYGCADMAGNVWEWTRSLHRPYPYDTQDGRENLDAGSDILRVVRGGSFYGSGRVVRCAIRSGALPFYHLVLRGFRVVVVPIPL